MDLQLEIVNAKSNKPLVTVYDVLDTFTVEELKKHIAGKKPKFRDINRLELRTEPKGKPLKDEVTLRELGIKNESIIYFKVLQQFCPTQIHPRYKISRTEDFRLGGRLCSSASMRGRCWSTSGSTPGPGSPMGT